MFVDVSIETCGELVLSGQGQVNNLTEVCLRDYGQDTTMVPCHSHYIYGTWRSKELGESHKGWGQYS